jgi:hypothetical protein
MYTVLKKATNSAFRVENEPRGYSETLTNLYHTASHQRIVRFMKVATFQDTGCNMEKAPRET